MSPVPYLPSINNVHTDIAPAHWLAYDLAKVLHGDISVRNIMIDEDGNGILIDWDFSKPVGPGERNSKWRTVSVLDFYQLIILTYLAGNLAVHVCQSSTVAQLRSFL